MSVQDHFSTPTSQTDPDVGTKPDAIKLSRRTLFKAVGGSSLLAATANFGIAGSLLLAPDAQAGESHEHDYKQRDGFSLLKHKQPNPHKRAVTAYQLRKEAALTHFREKIIRQFSNGDEALYADKRASFFKGLPQNDLAEVDLSAFDAFLEALFSGNPDKFDAIPLSSIAERRLANPQAAYAYDMVGVDSHATSLPPAPKFASAQMAAEAGEVYWQALVRDVPFRNYDTDPDVAAAIADLNAFSEPQGPKQNGLITSETLFRGGSPGDLIGPYVSQFLWHDVPYGSTKIVQQYLAPVAGVNFMTAHDEWLAIERGAAPASAIAFESNPRYINNGRAIGEYVHKDVVFQAYFSAAIIMLGYGPDALDPNNPYIGSANQDGFATFGVPHVLDLVTKAARVGLEGAWFHKWLIHRRLRAEVFGSRVENQLNGTKDYGIHPDILNSDAVARVYSANGTRLLPQAFPEGSPLHPSYPAGHAVLGGACATMLKAFFNEDFVIPDPVESSADGFNLDPWTGDDLTLGNEINKLASNIGIARCHAGVHYHSDSRGMTVGESQAIGILQDYSRTYNEHFAGFTLTKFDGQKVRIVDGKTKNVG